MVDWSTAQEYESGQEKDSEPFPETKKTESQVKIEEKDIIEFLNSKEMETIRRDPSISNGDWKNFIDSFEELEDVPNSRMATLIKGTPSDAGAGDSPSEIKKYLEEVFENEDFAFRSYEEFESELVDLFIDENFEKYAPAPIFLEESSDNLEQINDRGLVNADNHNLFYSPTSDFTREELLLKPAGHKKEELEKMASFMEQNGDLEQIMGTPHYVVTLDADVDRTGEEEVSHTDRDRIEREIDVLFLYENAYIGRTKRGSKRPEAQISMRKEVVERYSNPDEYDFIDL